jgi:glycosyltransferase involved in cell wall biosynthesis
VRALSLVTDAVPPRLRFGRWQTVLRALKPARPLASIERRPLALPAAGVVTPPRHVAADIRCVLVAGALDNGGIESVVATLARGLPACGVAVEVVCSSSGRVARELRAEGVRVTDVPTPLLARYLDDHRPDVVQIHRVDQGLLDAVSAAGVPSTPVFHAIESYLDDRAWGPLRALMTRGAPGIAVSGSVRRFFVEHVDGDIRVIVNGVDAATSSPADRDRRADRRAVGKAIGRAIGDDEILVVALQRYSDQKNPAGLVDAFLAAAERDRRLRLVVAGAPDNWLEYRRAEFAARSHPCGARVELLGDSDPAVLLSAADAFILDSFAEGGPLSALEAAAFGLPVVLSDVGFGRELLAATGGHGAVVPRANREFTQAAMSRERARRHQSNREAFAAALLAAVDLGRGRPGVPPEFSQETMVAAHASVLREAARTRSARHGSAPLPA